MNVLIISHMYPSSFNENTGIFVHQQIEALVNEGIKVRVISPVPYTPFPIKYLKPKWNSISKIPYEATRKGISVYYPRYLAFPRAWFFASSGHRMYNGIKKLSKIIFNDFCFDLIHAHVALPDGYAASIISKELNVPFLVTIHGQDLQQTINFNSKCKLAIDITLKNANRISVVSHKLEQLIQYNFPHCHQKVIVVANGIDPTKIYHAQKNKVHNDGEGPVIVSVSNLVRTKGIDLNLYAIQRLRNKYPTIKYYIVGDGPEHSLLLNLVQQLNLEKCVRFIGEVPHEKALQYIASCDILSLPSWSEGFGIVYLEAMACGKPVVGCKGEGIEDFVKHGNNGLLVESKNIDDLVHALDFLISHPSESKAIAERAKQFVLTNYTWKVNAQKTITIYEQMLYRCSCV